jgi:hypothetical protein
LAGIKPLCDGSRSDIAYLRDLPGRQYIFPFVHINHPFPKSVAQSKQHIRPGLRGGMQVAGPA